MSTSDHVSSESNERTVNNTVRHTYRVLSEAEKAQMVEIKDKGQALIDTIYAVGRSRELSLAVTNAEQAVMWAIKHVTGEKPDPVKMVDAVTDAEVDKFFSIERE